MSTLPYSRRLFLCHAVTATFLAGIPFAAATAGLDYEAGNNKIWPKNIVKAIQIKLAELGYEPGTADGLYGANTAEAISAYQHGEQLEVDGKISELLIAHLLGETEVE